MSRESAHELMQLELAEARPCHHCGEPRRDHYAGVLRGCRQGRTNFRQNAELGFTVLPIGRTEVLSTTETRHG